MKTRHSKQVLVGLSVFSDGVLHFLQIKKKFYIFNRNYLVALMIISNSLYDNATFLQGSERITFFTTWTLHVQCAYIGGLIQAEWHVLIKNIGLKIEWRLTDNQPFFEVG